MSSSFSTFYWDSKAPLSSSSSIPWSFVELSVLCITFSPSLSFSPILVRLLTELDDYSSSSSFESGFSFSSLPNSSSSSSLFSFDSIYLSASLSLSSFKKLSVSNVRFFFIDGAEDLVPVLFVAGGDCFYYGFFTSPTLPLRASFYFISAFSFAIFSSWALHSAM